MLPRVGALVEGPAFHPYLSGRDNLRRLDAADRTADPATCTQRIAGALDRVGLQPRPPTKRYRNYSLGMRQRLGIAAALLQPRELLILDEPTNGLDPQGTREVRSLVSDLAATGVTVLLSTHLLSEVEQICTHVGVMHIGKLVAQSRLTDLRAQTAQRILVETDRRRPTPRPAWRRLGLTDIDRGTPVGVTAVLGSAAATGGHRRAGPRRRAGAGLRAGAGEPGGRVRHPDRGGLRCQRLRSRGRGRSAASRQRVRRCGSCAPN